MVNEDLIETRIREINDAIQMLRELITRSFEELGIYERLSMRYLVIQLVEAASSICMHILSEVFDERAEGFPECFTRLGVKRVIPRELAERLASAARLRNLLVYRYWEIVDEKVYEAVGRGLRGFEELIVYVRRLQSGRLDPEASTTGFKYYQLPVEERSKLVERLKLVEGVTFAYIYGSFMKGGSFRDIDVAVWVSDPERAFHYTVELSAKLEAELGIPVDLHVLNEAPLPFKYHVLAEGEPLFSRDGRLQAIVADETARIYVDFKEFIRKQKP